MCFIAAVKRIGQPDTEIETTIRGMLYEKIMRNGDGFAVVGKEVLKTLNPRLASKAVREADLGSLVAHFRIATTGKVNEANIHWYEEDGWNFMHNGTIYKYSSYGVGAKDEDETDSLQFFKRLVKDIKHAKAKTNAEVAEVINEACSDSRFNGRALLYQQSTDRMFLIGDWEISVVNENYLVISSTRVDLTTTKEYKDYNGFLFVEEVLAGYDIQANSIDDIGVISDFSTDKFRYSWLHTLKAGFNNYTPTRTPNTTPTTTLNEDLDDWSEDLPIPPGHKVNNSGFGIRKVLGV